jgi:hypothetical protein
MVHIPNKAIKITEQGREVIKSEKFNDFVKEIKQQEQRADRSERMKQQGIISRAPVLKRGSMNQSPHSLISAIQFSARYIAAAIFGSTLV